MNRPSQIVLNFFVFLSLFLLAASLQTSLFHWLIGEHATIQIALAIVTYICLYRNPPEALLFTILACYMMGLLTTMLQSIGIFAGVCIFLMIQAVRKQVYSSGHVHFTWTALAAIFLFHVITWMTSLIFEPIAPPFRPLSWILEILITALFTRLLYSLFVWLDQKTKRLTISELNG